jgi:threonine dehydrogenase-like Zn-dependent dehydrogenase
MPLWGRNTGAAGGSCWALLGRFRRPFADRVAVPAANIVPLPENMPEELGRWWSRWRVGYHASGGGQPTADGPLCWSSAVGRSGKACLLAARRLGVRAMALSDVSPSRRDLCARLGAEVIDPSAGNLPRRWRSARWPATLVVDAVG